MTSPDGLRQVYTLYLMEQTSVRNALDASGPLHKRMEVLSSKLKRDELAAIPGPTEPPAYSPRVIVKSRLIGERPRLPSDAVIADIHHPQETDLGPGEENIGSFQLASPNNTHTQILDVIRSADRVLRLIFSERSNDKIGEAKRTEVTLNTRNDAFIPIHTISGPSSSNSFPVETITGYGTRARVFDLLQRKDVHAFQNACTNYNVVSFKRNVWFTVTSRERGLVRRFASAGQDLGYGEIQLWQWPTTQMPAEEKHSPSQSLNRVSSAFAESIGLSKWSII